VLVFVYELALPPAALERLVYLFGIVPARYTHSEWARWVGLPTDDYCPFLTSMFLHGGTAHLIANMWTLWIFGDNVEDRMGSTRFLIFYLTTGVVAGLVHWLTNPHSTIPTVGASGAIAGVLGAYFVLFPRSRIITFIPILFWPFFIEIPAVTYLFIWFFSQLLSGTLVGLGPDDVGGIAWWAHVGGFAAGALLHPFFLIRSSRTQRSFDPDEYGIEGAWTA
jgi:membrane associated rhomboid family serine protease